MGASLLRLTMVALATAGVACTRSPHLAAGPIEVGPLPTRVRFEQPVRPAGPGWELCFELSTPGQSQQAHGIPAVLVAATGKRYALADPAVDRRGEATVCQVGRIVPKDTTGLGVALADSIVFEAVELSSPTLLRVRGLRGGGRS